MRTLLSLLTVCGLGLATTVEAGMQNPRARGALSLQEQAKLLNRVEDYLNSIKTIEAEFSQTNPQGSGYLTGKIYIKRPGKMRVEYEPSCGNIITADGTWLNVYDAKTDQVNSSALKDTPADVLLREKVSLSGDLKIMHIKRDHGTVRVVMTKKGDTTGGYMTFVFTDEPLQLKQWIITDSKGNENRFSLLNAKFGGRFRDDLFTKVKG